METQNAPKYTREKSGNSYWKSVYRNETFSHLAEKYGPLVLTGTAAIASTFLPRDYAPLCGLTSLTGCLLAIGWAQLGFEVGERGWLDSLEDWQECAKKEKEERQKLSKLEGGRK